MHIAEAQKPAAAPPGFDPSPLVARHDAAVMTHRLWLLSHAACCMLLDACCMYHAAWNMQRVSCYNLRIFLERRSECIAHFHFRQNFCGSAVQLAPACDADHDADAVPTPMPADAQPPPETEHAPRPAADAAVGGSSLPRPSYDGLHSFESEHSARVSQLMRMYQVSEPSQQHSVHCS